jgi:di/tricarboxylate transporter
MDLLHIVAIGVLALVLVLGTTRSVNLGVLGLVAAFGVGSLVFHESVSEILSAFPTQIFVLLAGVTFMFSIASRNGTVGWIIDSTLRLLGNRGALVPWVFYTLACTICSMGALGPAVGAILAPIAFGMGAAYGIHSLRMALAVGLGAIAGSFSPLGPLGAIVNGVMENAGLEASPGYLYLWTIVLTTIVAVAAMTITARGSKRVVAARVPAGANAGHAGSAGSLGGTTTITGGARGEVPAPRDASEASAPRDASEGYRAGLVERLTTIGGLGALMFGALVLDGDIGFLALTVGVALSLLFSKSGQHAVKDVSWGVILLICGILTYVGLLQRNGTVEWVGDGIVGIGVPLVAAFLICLIGAVVSAVASTTGILAVLVPLSVPLIATGDVSALGLGIALALSSSLVDLSPFSTGGAIFLAEAPEHERPVLFRGLMVLTGSMILCGPALTWLLLIAPGWV